MNLSPPPVLRVVGPPGSGKSLLIVSLVEALRRRGYRSAAAVRRETPRPATVLTLSNGGRATLESTPGLEALRSVVASLDMGVHLLIGEGYEERAIPAIALGAQELDSDVLALVAPEDVARGFAASGPGGVDELAALVEERVLGVRRPHPPAPSPPQGARGSEAPRVVQRTGWLGRLRRGLRG